MAFDCQGTRYGAFTIQFTVIAEELEEYSYSIQSPSNEDLSEYLDYLNNPSNSKKFHL